MFCNLWDMNLTSVADGVLQWSSNSHFSQLLQAGTNGTLADGCPWSNRNPRLEHPSSIGLSGGVGWSTLSEQIRIPDLLHLIYLLLPDFDRGNKSGARARPRCDHGGARVRSYRGITLWERLVAISEWVILHYVYLLFKFSILIQVFLIHFNANLFACSNFFQIINHDYWYHGEWAFWVKIKTGKFI